MPSFGYPDYDSRKDRKNSAVITPKEKLNFETFKKDSYKLLSVGFGVSKDYLDWLFKQHNIIFMEQGEKQMTNLTIYDEIKNLQHELAVIVGKLKGEEYCREENKDNSIIGTLLYEIMDCKSSIEIINNEINRLKSEM